MDINNNDSLKVLVEQVVDTLKFQGVTILDIDEISDIPHFTVQVSNKKRFRTLDDLLTFVYWTLWTLTYGEYKESKSHLKIKLDYTVINQRGEESNET